MAGDFVSATTQYYYQNPVSNTSGNSTLPEDVISALLQEILLSTATNLLLKGATANINSQLNGNNSFKNFVAPDANNPNGNNPKAYLTVIFFDEQFNFVDPSEVGQTSIQRVPQNTAKGNNNSLNLLNIKAPKNGYAYIYISNESIEPVYFDNFKVTHTRGRIIEENHYYAFGLKIAGISAKKLGDGKEGYLSNKN